MRKVPVALTLAILALTGLSVRADEAADRAVVVRELLKRSRFLEHINFSVPVDLYERYLRALARPGEAEKPPVAVLAEEALYEVVSDKGGDPTLTARLRFRVLSGEKCGALRVLSAVRVWTNVAVNGEPADLPIEGDWHLFSPTAPGVYEIAAKSALRLSQFAGRLDLGVPRTIRTLVATRSPRPWQVRVNDLPAASGDEDGTDVRFALTPTDRLAVRWSPPVPQREHAPQYRLTGDIAWDLGTGRMQVTAAADVAILLGRTERIDLTLPAGAAQVEITGPDVRKAQVSPGRAAVFLRGRIAERTRLTLRYDLPAAGEQARFTPPGIRDGRWAGGTLVVTNTAGGSEVLPGEAVGLKELAIAAIPDSAAALLAGPPALAYAISSPGFSLSVETLDLGEFALRETIADLAHFQVAYRADGALVGKAEYEIRNRTRQFLTVTLPPGSALLLAKVNDKTVPAAPAGRADRYLLPLVRSMASVRGLVSFPVEVVCLCRSAPPKEGEARVPLPRVDLPIAYAWCEVYLPDGLKVRKVTGPMAPVAQYSSETAVADLSYGSARLAEGYERGERFTAGAGLAEPVPEPETPQLLDSISADFLSVEQTEDEAQEAAEVADEGPAPLARSGLADVGGAMRPGEPTDAPDVSAVANLSANYYRTGRDRYEGGEYDQAAEALNKAIKLAPKSVEADNARRLLANIDLTRGKLALRSKSEKVAGLKVQKEVQAGQTAYFARQQQAVKKYHEALAEGDEEEATVQFQAAEALGRELEKRGADLAEQEAILSDLRVEQKKIATRQRRRAGELRERAKKLEEAGDYAEALQAAQQAQQYYQITAGADEDRDADKDLREYSRLQQDIEQLAVRTVTEEAKARRIARKPAREAQPTLTPPVPRERLLEAADRLDTTVTVRGSGRLALGGQAGGGQTSAPGVAPVPRPVQPAQPVPTTLPGGDLPTTAPRVTASSGQAGTIVMDARADAVMMPHRADVRPFAGRVTAIRGDLVSVNVGNVHGVRPGMKLTVTRNSQPVGSLRLEVVETGQSAGVFTERKREPQVGDRVAFGEPTASGELATEDAGQARGQSRPGLMLDRVEQERRARKLGADARIDQYVRQSRERLAIATDRSDFTEAVMLARQARLVLSLHEDSYPPGEYRAKLAEIDRYLSFVEQARREWISRLGPMARPEAQRALPGEPIRSEAERRRGGEGRRTGGGRRDREVVTRTYDIRNLRLGANVAGPRVDFGNAPSAEDAGWGWATFDETGEGNQAPQRPEGEIADIVRSNLGDAAGEVWVTNGRLAVTGTAEGQHSVSRLLERLSEARGRQVEMGEALAQQRAEGKGGAVLVTDGKGDLDDDGGWGYRSGMTAEADRREAQAVPDVGSSEQLREFIGRNYSWQFGGGQAGGEALFALTDGDAAVVANAGELARTLRFNLGQKVPVSSTNLNVDRRAARQLGARFVTGNNDVTYTVIDEAQFVTLMQLDQENRRGTKLKSRVAANERFQETIVGTDALLANSMVANVTYAGDEGNVLDVADNGIRLAHDRYVLIANNDGSLTAVRAGQMQHWTEAPTGPAFANVPYTIDVPRVGQRLKLEKTLVDPSDVLVIRVAYDAP